MALRFKAVVLGAVAAAALAGTGMMTLAWAQASGEQVVKERSELMSAQNAANRTLAAAAKGGEIDAKVVKAAEDINATAKRILPLFPPGTGDDKLRTRAKPAIWQDWAKFEGSAKDLESSSATLVTAAKAGDKAGVVAGFTKVNEACNACHKDFRGPSLR